MAIDERNQKQRIRRLLQDEEVQARVQENIRRGREDAKVTIGRASELFNIRPTKLRELDSLLQPGRPKDASNVQRQYSLTELKKIAIISELLNNERIPLSDIPADIDEIWNSVSSFPEEQPQIAVGNASAAHVSIDSRVENANKEQFWRYFAYQALHLALDLICEDLLEPIAGLLLPLRRKANATVRWNPEELNKLGECLIGWRDQNCSYHTFYDPSPFFAYPSDFRVRGLAAVEEQEPEDKTFVVLERRTNPLPLPRPLVETVRRLLAPIYEDVDIWQPYFDTGMRDVFYPTLSFSSIASNSMLTSFAEMIVRMGGKTASGQHRWKFCSILLPNNELLSLQQRTLIVRAQSSKSPYIIGQTILSTDAPFLSLSLRAFQSSHVLYRPFVSTEDATIAYRDKEEPIQSAIAVPIEGRDGLPIAILYLSSEETNAFDVEYQRVLRLIGRMIGELLQTSDIRQRTEERVRDIITRPSVINKTLGAFPSENAFIKDVEDILSSVNESHNSFTEDETSFIAINVDNVSHITSRYGDLALVNLSKALANRIEEQIGLLFDKPKDCKIYYIYADRFYLSLKHVSLEQARENAEKLRLALAGKYVIPILPTSINQPRSQVALEPITVRLGVSSYKHSKFLKLLNERSPETCVADVTYGSVLYYLDVALNMAKQEGGNCIISYYPPEPPKYAHSRQARWSPPSNEDSNAHKV